MDHLDYDAPATLRISRGKADEQSETGTVAAMVERAMELNRDPNCTVLLEIDETVLGFGLIEALYHRPDFPGKQPTGWLSEQGRAPQRQKLRSMLLDKVAAATGLNLARETQKPVVLLVEDEPLVRMLGADLLSEAGFEVVEAENGDEALAALERHPEIGVLFTDVNMPGSLDGLALATVARDRRPDLKVLVGSGVVRPGLDELPSDSRFLPKPYRPAMVVETLREMLR